MINILENQQIPANTEYNLTIYLRQIFWKKYQNKSQRKEDIGNDRNKAEKLQNKMLQTLNMINTFKNNPSMRIFKKQNA